MKLYSAGVISSGFHKAGRTYGRLTENEVRMRDSIEYYLESFHYVHTDNYLRRIQGDKIKVFLDSGAYSALTQGTSIDFGKFVEYIHKNRDVIEMVSVLDCIDFNDPANAAKMSFHSLKEMEKRGITDVMPCYHFGEPEAALEYYLENYEYVTIGGLVGASTKALQRWLDRMFERYICKPDGSLKRKIHLFGVTSLPLMMRYPATSVDSSTWVQWSLNGLLLLPVSGKQINISAGSSFTKMAGQHFDNLRPLEQEILVQEIEASGGDVERLRTYYGSRWAWNVWAFPEYLRLREHIKPKVFTATDPELF